MREFQVHLEEECHNYLFTDIKQKTLKVGKIQPHPYLWGSGKTGIMEIEMENLMEMEIELYSNIIYDTTTCTKAALFPCFPVAHPHNTNMSKSWEP